jgi:hypothetical protein
VKFRSAIVQGARWRPNRLARLLAHRTGFQLLCKMTSSLVQWRQCRTSVAPISPGERAAAEAQAHPRDLSFAKKPSSTPVPDGGDERKRVWPSSCSYQNKVTDPRVRHIKNFIFDRGLTTDRPKVEISHGGFESITIDVLLGAGWPQEVSPRRLALPGLPQIQTRPIRAWCCGPSTFANGKQRHLSAQYEVRLTRRERLWPWIGGFGDA